MSETVVCSSCGVKVPLPDVSVAPTIDCPACGESLPTETGKLDGWNIDGVDFDDLLAVEQTAQAVAEPTFPSPLGAAPVVDRTDAVLQSYGATEDKLPNLLPASGIKRIYLGLKTHLVATLAFTLFLFLGSVGVGFFLGGAALLGYVQQSQETLAELDATESAREARTKSDAQLANVGAILVGISLICLIGGAIPLSASIAVDVFSSVMCLKFPPDGGARGLQIAAAACKAAAGVCFLAGLTVGIVAGMKLAGALFIGLAASLLPVMAAWACFCGSLSQLSAYMDREDLVKEGRGLLFIGFVTIGILVLIPIGAIWMIASGNGFWLLAILGPCLLAFSWVCRHDPMTYLVEGMMYISSMKFCFGYANYIGTLQYVVERAPTDPKA